MVSDSIRVRVTTKASRERVVLETAPDGTQLYRVYVTVVPEDGKANDAVIKLLAKELGIAKSRLKITQGHTCREKRIKINPR